MLSINGLNNREPADGDVFIVMSKDCRKIRLFSVMTGGLTACMKRNSPRLIGS